MPTSNDRGGRARDDDGEVEVAVVLDENGDPRLIPITEVKKTSTGATSARTGRTVSTQEKKAFYSPQWYETDRGKQLLALESAAMKDRFPRFVMKRDSAGNLFWRGTVIVNEKPFELKVLYPENYKDNAQAYPRVFVESEDVNAEYDRAGYTGKRHLIGGHLCLFNPADGRGFSFDIARGNVVQCLVWAMDWLLNYQRALLTGRWHGIEEHHPDAVRSHEKAGYV